MQVGFINISSSGQAGQAARV